MAAKMELKTAESLELDLVELWAILWAFLKATSSAALSAKLKDG